MLIVNRIEEKVDNTWTILAIGVFSKWHTMRDWKMERSTVAGTSVPDELTLNERKKKHKNILQFFALCDFFDLSFFFSPLPSFEEPLLATGFWFQPLELYFAFRVESITYLKRRETCYFCWHPKWFQSGVQFLVNSRSSWSLRFISQTASYKFRFTEWTSRLFWQIKVVGDFINFLFFI